MSEYLNIFTQLLKYALDEVNAHEKKEYVFLEGLVDDVQFQLLNTNYENFQKLVDKALIIENNLKEMKNGDKRKLLFHSQSFGSNTRPRLRLSCLLYITHPCRMRSFIQIISTASLACGGWMIIDSNIIVIDQFQPLTLSQIHISLGECPS
jgi:hypothetical protein